ncbi:MAG: RagB/SusD family nutrient uptake outer membrane protein [Pedobacter sp.]
MKKLLQSLFFLLLVAGTAMAQNRTVTGTVTDKAAGKPVPGVNVKIKGTTVATLTGANGTFSISVPQSATALEFSSLGFATQSVTIGFDNVVNIALEESSSELNEVIVVGYGTAKKESYTGSASVVGGKNFADRPNTSLQKSLQGAAAGVQVTSTSGQPGAATAVRVRGIGSLSATASPLYVVDGIATTSGDLTQVAQSADILSALNPNDIESVTILKDAAATAIYGSRGANGVVLITTKQGRNGDTRFNASITTGRSGQAVEKHDVLNAQEYYKLYFDSYYAQRLAAGLAPDAAAVAANTLVRNRLTVNPFNTVNPFVAGGNLAPGAALFYDTNWRDEVLRTGITNDVNVSASGGSEKFKFYTSGGFFNAQKTAYLAETRALRADAYFWLVRWFGKPYTLDPEALGVPIVKMPLGPTDVPPTRSKVKEVYAFILEDLLFAEANIPATKTSIYRMNKAAIQGFLARVYLTMGNYPEASKYAKLARAAKPLSTGAALLTGFNNPTSEWIYGINVRTDDNQGFIAVHSFYDPFDIGYSSFRATDSFLNSFAEVDVRKKQFLVGGKYTRRGTEGWLINKFDFNSTPANNQVLIRSSEMYLIEAEAEARQGAANEAAAKTALLAIQSRAGVATTPSLNTGAALIAEIMAERGKELYGEGHKFFDLLRTKTAVTRAAGVGHWAVVDFQPGDNKLVLPIPQVELNANPAMKTQQNPGYSN